MEQRIGPLDLIHDVPGVRRAEGVDGRRRGLIAEAGEPERRPAGRPARNMPVADRASPCSTW
jgi:hypothetical protein